MEREAWIGPRGGFHYAKKYDYKENISYVAISLIGNQMMPIGDNELPYLYSGRTKDKYQNKGYYRKLLNCVENKLKSLGYPGMCLFSEQRNVSLYEHLGFTNKGIEDGCFVFVKYF